MANAATVVVQQYVSNNDVTINRMNSNQNAIVNQINGNIEGGGVNIKAGSITSQDLNTTVSTITRWAESFNNFTVSGQLPATSANLASDISAGTSYVSGYRVATGATNHTYTASKDTYVYISNGGYFIYSEVANGATAPTTPTDSLLLAKVVSSGTALTSVSDLRQLSIQITATTSNFPTDYRNQAQFVRASTTTGYVAPGQLAIGTTTYSNTAATSTKSLATGSNWIEGSTPNLANLKFYAYAYNNSGSAFDLKYASADPTASDSSGGTSGTLQYYTTGGTTYRALAWISADSGGQLQTYNYAQFPSATTSNSVTYQTGEVASGSTTIPYDDSIPQINEGNEYMNVPFRASNALNTVVVTVVVQGNGSAEAHAAAALFQDTTANALAVGDSYMGAGNQGSVVFTHKMLAGNTNLKVFRVRAGSNSGTFTFNGVGGARKYGGAFASSIKVDEIPA
jgi:hypothetical protein